MDAGAMAIGHQTAERRLSVRVQFVLGLVEIVAVLVFLHQRLALHLGLAQQKLGDRTEQIVRVAGLLHEIELAGDREGKDENVEVRDVRNVLLGNQIVDQRQGGDVQGVSGGGERVG